MGTRCLRLFTLILLFTLLVPALAAAQSAAWSVTPFALVSSGEGFPGPGRSPGFGAAIAFRASPQLSFEIEASRLFLESGVFDRRSMTNVSANGLVMLPLFRLQPYATVGAGVQRNASVLTIDPITDPTILNELLALGLAPASGRLEGSSTRFVINVGGGAEYPLGQRLRARADVRRVLPRQHVHDYWRIYGGMRFVIN